jgi:hypothetical protein
MPARRRGIARLPEAHTPALLISPRNYQLIDSFLAWFFPEGLEQPTGLNSYCKRLDTGLNEDWHPPISDFPELPSPIPESLARSHHSKVSRTIVGHSSCSSQETRWCIGAIVIIMGLL